MKAKNWLTLLLFFCTATNAFSQVDDGANQICMTRRIGGPTPLIIKLKQTTLLVVVDSENSEMQRAFAAAFNQYWKFTPYKYIRPEDISKYYSNPSYSFLAFMDEELFQKGFENTIVYYPYMNKKIEEGGSCDYVIFLGKEGAASDNHENRFDMCYDINVGVLAFTPRVPVKGMMLREVEMKTLPYLPILVQRIEEETEFMYTNKREREEWGNTFWAKYLYSGESYGLSISVSFYEKTPRDIHSTDIYIDSSSTDSLSILYIAKILEIDNRHIHLVNAQTIAAKLAENTPGVLAVRQTKSTEDYLNPTTVYQLIDSKRIVWAEFYVNFNSYTPAPDLFDGNLPHRSRYGFVKVHKIM